MQEVTKSATIIMALVMVMLLLLLYMSGIITRPEAAPSAPASYFLEQPSSPSAGQTYAP